MTKTTKEPTQELEQIQAPTEEAKETKAPAKRGPKPKAEKAPKAERKTAKAPREKKAPKAKAEKAEKPARAPRKPKAPAAKVFLEYRGRQIAQEDVVSAILASWTGEAVKTLEVYVKPEENAAYYVVNGAEGGKVEL